MLKFVIEPNKIYPVVDNSFSPEVDEEEEDEEA